MKGDIPNHEFLNREPPEEDPMGDCPKCGHWLKIEPATSSDTADEVLYCQNCGFMEAAPGGVQIKGRKK